MLTRTPSAHSRRRRRCSPHRSRPLARSVLVGLRDVPVDVEVPGRRGDLDVDPVHLVRHDDLTAQPAGFRQPVGHVQHVLLVLRGLLQDAVEGLLVRDDDVTGAAGADALAGPLQLDVVPLGDLQEGLADVGVDVGLHLVALVVDEVDVHRIGVVAVDVGSTVPPLRDRVRWVGGGSCCVREKGSGHHRTTAVADSPLRRDAVVPSLLLLLRGASESSGRAKIRSRSQQLNRGFGDAVVDERGADLGSDDDVRHGG
mmetsp:Transcript_10641/g.25610  ORF Transcript_10641/g.25610 Transcript_10641/m.25610 type:complete len:256 (-) Transcript_10641:298-1065(-)